MGKAKRKKTTRVKDLAAKKAHRVRGGKQAKEKTSGGLLGAVIGGVLGPTT